MVQNFRENVEISNKVNFRDYSKDFGILRPRVVLLCPLTQHDHDRIASKREMPHVEIQPCIKEFHVYKTRQLLSLCAGILFTVLFRLFSSALALLPACWQEEEICLCKGVRGDSVSRHRRSFIFFFVENKPIETIILFGTFSLCELLNIHVISTRPLLHIIFVIKIFVMHAESRNSRKYCSPKIWSYMVFLQLNSSQSTSPQ